MTVGELVMWSLLVAFGLAGSMLCSGFETGLYATSSVRATVRARAPSATVADRITARAIERPERALTTLLLFNNAFNYLATLAITALLVSIGLSDAALIVLQAAVLTPVLLVFAESLPKEIFRAHAERLVRRFAPLFAVMQTLGVWTALVPLISGFAGLIGRIVGSEGAGALRSPRARTVELIKHGSGQLSEAQTGLIDRALRVETTRLIDEAVPIHAATTVRAGWIAARARREIARHPHARYPVLDDRGRVVGVVRLADLVRQPGAAVSTLMTEPLRLDHALSAWDGLSAMIRSNTPFCIVERNGHAVAIATQKDLVEPLTGDLRDW